MKKTNEVVLFEHYDNYYLNNKGNNYVSLLLI